MSDFDLTGTKHLKGNRLEDPDFGHAENITEKEISTIKLRPMYHIPLKKRISVAKRKPSLPTTKKKKKEKQRN